MTADTTAQLPTEEASTEQAPPLRVLQRIVLPVKGNLDIVPLYVETDMDRGAELTRQEDRDSDRSETQVASATVGSSSSTVKFGLEREAESSGDLAARRSAVIRAGRRVSFGTYFNAFPASYWRRWSTVDSVVLRLRVSGEGTVIVYRSTARGHSHPVESVHLDATTPELVELDLPLTQFIDGGWYWFDIAAAGRDVQLVEAHWAAATERQERGHVSIGITTFNRPDFCVDGLRTLAESDEVLEIVDHIYVVDQGTQKIKDHPEFAEATAKLHGRLEVIEQGNLGGSGGFSRAMDETVRAGQSDYVLLLDDDVVTEPESILRAATFGDLARRPTIVGGHMFSLYDRSVLHAFGETVALYPFWWGSAPQTRQGHDFGRRNLRNTPWLHRRVDVDYNGWWMCLIPTQVVRELGLALPVFIKWDDAEYGLRAGEAGYPTVSMPGVAVWHVPWQDKTDALDWQSYYHVRNRLVAALLHSPYDRGGNIVPEHMEFQIRHLLSMQYSTAALRVMAMEDVLSGPAHLHRELPIKMKQLRALRTEYADSRTATDVEDFPQVKRRKPPKRGKEPEAPKNPLGLVVKAALGAVRQIRPVDELALQHPQTSVPSQDAEWWRLSNVDSALVSAADGTATAWYQRNPREFRRLLQHSAAVHAKLMREWPRLAKQYQDALPSFTSPERWRETFETS